MDYNKAINKDDLWRTIVDEVILEAKYSPLLGLFLQNNILQHNSFDSALCYVLAEKLSPREDQVNQWQQYLQTIVSKNTLQPQTNNSLSKGKPNKNMPIVQAALADLICQLQSNASIKDHYSPLLFFAGYHALQCYRFAHYCWHNNQRAMANYIQARSVSLFGVDIHPAASIGSSIFMDHSVAVVIGETAVIEDDVTIFQSVTLGGTGKGSGDRHPKVRQGAFIGAGALILGNIEIGKNAKVAAGAVVLKDVADNTTMINPTAKLVI